MTQKRSEYYFNLEINAKSRYEEKLAAINLSTDPFSFQDNEFELSKNYTMWPDITYGNIFNYLINFPSTYTKKRLDAYKSLESYKYVLSGLVFDVQVKRINNARYLVRAKIRHGQSMFTKTPNNAWICTETDGQILYGHCSCMAGLGEVCSHVGAIMFYLHLTSDYCKRNFDNACTSQPCTWLPPSAKEVEFSELSNIDFSDPKTRLRKNRSSSQMHCCVETPPLPTKDEQNEFYEKLHQTGADSAILRIVPVFCERFVPSTAQLQTIFFDFYHENYETLLYHELLNACVRRYISININANEIELVEQKTREQTKSELWFKARSGVITASNFRACCHTNIAEPSKSLIMKICYPSKNRFSSEATDYGSKNEKIARDVLTEYLSNIHENVSVTDSGLFRSVVYPFLGASPDGILKCSCCETIFVIEIKCPFKATTIPLTELAVNDEAFCMEYVDGQYVLKKQHAYYYQIQLQMLLTNAKAGYFFVYSKESSLCQLIIFDDAFLAEKVPIAEKFFVYGILPELLGKWHSRTHIAPPSIKEKANSSENICTCQNQNNISATVNCSDKSCIIKTYHLVCLGLETKPKGKWFCPYCSRKKTRGKKKNV